MTGQLASLLAECSRVKDSAREQLPTVWAEIVGQLAQLARALGVDITRAEDVLQDVYVTASEKSPCEATHEELRRWLFTVTANRCKLEHRRHSRWQRMLGGVGHWWMIRQTTASETDLVSQAEDRELVRQALDQLPVALRSVLVLRYFSGFNSKEISEILEMPDSTVRSHLRSARRKLAQALSHAGYIHD